jgi:PAS domain S-box-containing protein
VLALYWYAREYPSNVQFEQGLLRALRADPRGTPEYYSEYLEIDRFPPEEHSRVLRDFIRQKYAHLKIDVIVAEAAEPFQFLLTNRSLFPDVPIVYNVLGPPATTSERPAPGVVGIFGSGAYRKTLEMARSIHPGTEQVIVINSLPNQGGKARERIVREELAPFEQEITLRYLTDLPTDVLLREISQAPPRSIVLYGRHAAESLGSALDPIEALSLFSRSASVPIYSVSATYLGHGIVGGYLLDLETLGMQAGQLALRILAGERADDMPATHAAVLSPTFDWNELRRWGIDTSRLPPGADIRFRVPTVWELYRWYIVGAIALLALQAVMIVSLVLQRSVLRDNRERYAMATAAGGVGVWDWNLETNDIYVDPSLKKILGYEDHEIRNHLDDWGRYVHPDDAPAVMERAQAHLDGNTPLYEVEHRMRHRDGSTRWFLARGSAVRRDGRAVRVIGTDTDVTERKKSEQALQEVQSDLARVSRLTALGEFAASVAHEVRQPLTAIMMNAKTCLRWLGSATPDLTEIRAALVDVVDAGRRADELIQRNRQLFKDHTVQKAPLDINGVVQQVVVLARPRLQSSHVNLTTTLAQLPDVHGDRVELQQVLLNLIANSIDAMDGVDAEARTIDVSTAMTPDGMVKVSVKDSGVGLHGVDLKRMFTLSYTTKAAGTGVGLSISRSIVEAHGGKLWADANSGPGATFSFTLPLEPAAVAT